MTGPFADHAKKAVDTMRADWAKAVSIDTEMGGKLDAIKADIGRMKDSILGAATAAERKAFDEAMNLTGAGDHPAIVKAMWKMAQKVNEGTHVAGASPSPLGQTDKPTQRPSAAKALYPNLS